MLEFRTISKSNSSGNHAWFLRITKKTMFDSTCVNSESVSNDIDESDLQKEHKCNSTT
jgi:hypothetical protein